MQDRKLRDQLVGVDKLQDRIPALMAFTSFSSAAFSVAHTRRQTNGEACKQTKRQPLTNSRQNICTQLKCKLIVKNP